MREPSITSASNVDRPIAALALATLLAAVLAGCGGGGGGGSGGADAPPPPPDIPQVRLTGGSPFADGCEGVAGAGTAYVGSEVEPHVAAHPGNPAHLVAAWQQDRWSSGGARGLRSAASFDGGRSWTASAAAFSLCTGGSAALGTDFQRASDPWVTIGPDGVAHQIAIAFSGVAQTAGSVNAVLASRSPDGGLNWEPPVTLIRDEGVPFNDKESITADPLDPRYVYAVWDRLADNRGPIWFARSIDGGRTWERARPIHDPGLARQTINSQLVVLPEGALVVFFTRLVLVGTFAQATLMTIRSSDRGATWSEPSVLSIVQSRGTRDPDSGTLVRDATNLGTIAAGRNGQLAAVWQDSRFTNGARDAIALARSLDGGLTWTTPVRINAIPDVPAFVPSVAIRDDGAIGVTYHDFRDNTPAAGLPTSLWLARTDDGVIWRETRLAGPFDLAQAPSANGLFLGDYTGLAAPGGAFVPVYATAQSASLGDTTDVYASLASAATGTAASKSSTYRAGAPREPIVADAALTRALADSVRRTIATRSVR